MFLFIFNLSHKFSKSWELDKRLNEVLSQPAIFNLLWSKTDLFTRHIVLFGVFPFL